MRRLLWAIGAGGLLAALTAALPGLAAGTAPSIGINAAIRNVVQLRIVTEQAFRPAVLREPIHIGDAVTSGPNSAMQVLLKDQTVFTVGANARMTIDKFVYDPDRGTGALAASVARGAFRFMSGRAAHTPGEVAIKTPVASIGVRGTIVDVLVGDDAVALMHAIPGMKDAPICSGAGCADPSTATLIVLRGPGAKRVGNDHIGAIDITANGRTLLVSHAGVVVVPGAGQGPQGPFPLTQVVLHYFDASLATTPSTDRDHIGNVAQSLRAAAAEPSPTASLTLARIALEESASPADLQAALAAAAGDFAPGSRTFDLLMRVSALVMQTTNAAPVDDIGHELSSEDGRSLIQGLPPADSFADALTQFETQRVASSDMPAPSQRSAPISPQGDTLLAEEVVALIREAPPPQPNQGSPSS